MADEKYEFKEGDIVRISGSSLIGEYGPSNGSHAIVYIGGDLHKVPLKDLELIKPFSEQYKNSLEKSTQTPVPQRY